MIYQVRLSPPADRDLVRLPAFLELRSQRAARQIRSVLESAILGLREFPERGRPAPIQGFPELVVPFGRDAYILRYTVFDQDVLITSIRHSRENR